MPIARLFRILPAETKAEPSGPLLFPWDHGLAWKLAALCGGTLLQVIYYERVFLGRETVVVSRTDYCLREQDGQA